MRVGLEDSSLVDVDECDEDYGGSDSCWRLCWLDERRFVDSVVAGRLIMHLLS
jgi:hypothetical protein